MRRIGTTFLLVFATWVILTYSLRPESVMVGIMVSLVITVISRHLLARDTPKLIFHPLRWAAFLVYIAVMLYLEVIAHLDVARRVFTGKIRPAIVEVPVGFHTSLGKTLLANSITMTPGTLTVNAKHGSKFYVHTIGYRKGEDVGRMFRKFGIRVMG
jgi:multicomponent Na+:H+ antiporter subunit E